ncbi:MAG: DNA replication/repair protein RecF [Vampirovibrionales bacterium]|nr:DNA replication/repair protein RecF [Vampirovibrionales bacterium]
MKLHGLTARRFRNITDQTLRFSPGVNLILGENGQGKTNLLEAIYLLSYTRSPRTRQERELLMAGSQEAMLSATVMTRGGAGCELGARLSLSENNDASRLKTSFLLNASPVRTRSALLGHAPTVSFFNTDLLLLRGAPDYRRQWLDAAIVQYDKRHFTHLADYQRVRQQKARLLKTALETGMSGDARAQLAIWNDQLAQTGGRVNALRADYLKRLGARASLTYADLSAGRETLTMQYRCHALADAPTACADLSDPADETAWAQILAEALTRREPEEWRRAACLVGPHRDDVDFALDGLDACAYGSQGQQRTVALALKLSELALLSERLGDWPALLLDDVMAELDPKRQSELIDRLDPGIQVFLTTTHLEGRLKEAVGRLMRASDATAAAFEARGGAYCERALAPVSLAPLSEEALVSGL